VELLRLDAYARHRDRKRPELRGEDILKAYTTGKVKRNYLKRQGKTIIYKITMLHAKKSMDIARKRGHGRGMSHYNIKNGKYQAVILPTGGKYKLQKPLVQRFLEDVWIVSKTETKKTFEPVTPIELVPCQPREADVYFVYWNKRLYYKLPKNHQFIS